MIDLGPLPTPGQATVGVEAPRSSDTSAMEAGWDAFVAGHSRLILCVTRAVTRDEDAAMDAYTFVLEKLREDGCARLGAYREVPGCTFSTWVAVVARRLCFDHHRSRYGRPRAQTREALEAQAERRRLADLVATSIDPELAAPAENDAQFERNEILDALEETLTALSVRDRLLLRYRYDDELPAREIAHLMSFPTVFHVYRRLNAILAGCRRALQRRGFGADDV